MGSSKYIPKFSMNNTMLLFLEKHLLLKNYNFLEVKIIGNSLHCSGACQPSRCSIEYNYKVSYSPNKPPSVYPIYPKIKYNKEIHMYPQDDSLCLYYPYDFSWKSNSHLYNTIIPWTHEWFVFYELYLISGKWLHPSVPHSGKNKIK
ncbi:MAG: hypothetical protein ABI550_10175 [Ignavibacteriaceae bacterium]